jgi:hypothetical protein
MSLNATSHHPITKKKETYNFQMTGQTRLAPSPFLGSKLGILHFLFFILFFK